jgi:hypothetical protein
MIEFINQNASIIISAVGISLAAFLTNQSNRRQKDLIVKDLFKEFNERYSKLNDDLHFIVDNKLDLKSLRTNRDCLKQLNSLYDYLDLCAEEYYWYNHKKVIDKVAWKGWQAGMQYWCMKCTALKQLWDEEKGAKNLTTYYLKDNQSFFKENQL